MGLTWVVRVHISKTHLSPVWFSLQISHPKLTVRHNEVLGLLNCKTGAKTAELATRKSHSPWQVAEDAGSIPLPPGPWRTTFFAARNWSPKYNGQNKSKDFLAFSIYYMVWLWPVSNLKPLRMEKSMVALETSITNGREPFKALRNNA